MTLVALAIGFALVGPPVCWLLGLFNPIGFIGVRPWQVPESARAAGRQNRLWTPQFHEEYERLRGEAR